MTDPWQRLFLTNMLLCGWFIGSLLTLPQAGRQGVMIVYWKSAMALGFVLGEVLARNKFRDSVS